MIRHLTTYNLLIASLKANEKELIEYFDKFDSINIQIQNWPQNVVKTYFEIKFNLKGGKVQIKNKDLLKSESSEINFSLNDMKLNYDDIKTISISSSNELPHVIIHLRSVLN